MKRKVIASAALPLLLLAGCQSTAQFMAAMQPKAIAVAENRGRFELNCPAATGQVLSEQDVPPELRAVRFQAPDRAVFTIGVSGCGARATYVVVCPDDGSGNCFAADGRR
jgi:hypothetical protein